MDKKLLEYIRQTAEEIKPKLLPKPGHSVRNPYAHIFLVVKILCKASYDQADPNKVKAIVEAIRRNPNGNAREIFEVAKGIWKDEGLKNTIQLDQIGQEHK